MSKFMGRTLIDVDGPEDAARLIAQHLRSALRRTIGDFPDVHGFEVTYDERADMVVVELTLETDDSDNLDDVAAKVLDRSFELLTQVDPSESEELSVMESALIPA